MKVKCIINHGALLSSQYYHSGAESEIYYDGKGINETVSFPLVIGKEYLVYAMALNYDYMWYFVANENYRYYPIWYPCALFDVVDERISKYWVYSHQTGINFIQPQTFWAFPEWAEDPDYYTKLTSSYHREIKLFEGYKILMDNEFTR